MYGYYQPQPQQSPITWVQGETGAKSYLVAPGQSVLLMDSEASRFYIKSSDQSGMPMALRTFEYKEVTQGSQSGSVEYVTHDDLTAMESRLMQMMRGDKHE